MQLDDVAVVSLRLEALKLAGGDVQRAQVIMDFLLGDTDKQENAKLRQEVADLKRETKAVEATPVDGEILGG